MRAAKNITYVCLSILATLSSMVFAITMETGLSYSYQMGHFSSLFGNEIRAGTLEAFMALLFSIVTLLSLIGGKESIFSELNPARSNKYYLMMNMLVSAMLAIIYTNDIFTSYVFIEILTITACYIVAAKADGRALVSSMVYLIMSLIGSCLVLMSIALLYGVTGHLLFPGLQQSIRILAMTGEYRLPLFVLVAMMTAGLAIKSALFPFHSWLPDAHSSAITSSSSVLSGLIVKCYFILLTKLMLRVFGLELMGELHMPNVLLAFGATGIIYGSLQAMRQRDIKRMLSYSSIAQVGFISVALGLNTFVGISTAFYHITAHAIAKAMLFTSAGGLAAVSGHKKDFDSLRGSAYRDPFSGAAFIIGGLAMTGIPPFFGFFSKMNLTYASMDTPYFVAIIFVVVIAGTVMSAMYYFPAIARILLKPSSDTYESHESHESPVLSLKLVLCVFVAATIFIGLYSDAILRIIEQGLLVFA